MDLSLDPAPTLPDSANLRVKVNVLDDERITFVVDGIELG